MITRAAVLFSGLVIIASLAACTDQEPGNIMTGVTSTPAALGVTVAPAALVFTPLPFAGGGCHSFSSSFNLVIQNGGGSDLFLNAATIHMIDGTNLGGSPVTIPSADMTSRFGSVLIRRGSRRVFPFQEQFGCSGAFPTGMRLEVLLFDVSGVPTSVSVDVPAT